MKDGGEIPLSYNHKGSTISIIIHKGVSPLTAEGTTPQTATPGTIIRKGVTPYIIRKGGDTLNRRC